MRNCGYPSGGDPLSADELPPPPPAMVTPALRPAPEPWPEDNDQYEARITRMAIGYHIGITRGLIGYAAGWFAWTNAGARRKAARIIRRKQRADERQRTAEVIRYDEQTSDA